MRLTEALVLEKLRAGGPGSGCNPESGNCGRKPTEAPKESESFGGKMSPHALALHEVAKGIGFTQVSHSLGNGNYTYKGRGSGVKGDLIVTNNEGEWQYYEKGKDAPKEGTGGPQLYKLLHRV